MLIRPQAGVLGDLGPSLAGKQEVQKEVLLYEGQCSPRLPRWGNMAI